jgi:hypothetical protein
MEFTIEVEKLHDKNPKADYVPDPEEALDIVERLRLEAGRFLYEYPAPFRRTIEVVRRK